MGLGKGWEKIKRRRLLKENATDTRFKKARKHTMTDITKEGEENRQKGKDMTTDGRNKKR